MDDQRRWWCYPRMRGCRAQRNRICKYYYSFIDVMHGHRLSCSFKIIWDLNHWHETFKKKPLGSLKFDSVWCICDFCINRVRVVSFTLSAFKNSRKDYKIITKVIHNIVISDHSQDCCFTKILVNCAAIHKVVNSVRRRCWSNPLSYRVLPSGWSSELFYVLKSFYSFLYIVLSYIAITGNYNHK
jgi:hypothetical protein